jgi:hypothetical protein
VRVPPVRTISLTPRIDYITPVFLLPVPEEFTVCSTSHKCSVASVEEMQRGQLQRKPHTAQKVEDGFS